MNVASLELCKQLYEVSGYDGTDLIYIDHETLGLEVFGREITNQLGHGSAYICEAYDLGFLLRELPPYVAIYKQNEKWWSWDIRENHPLAWNSVDAKTPEDCACKLVIRLINQGILKPESEGQG